MRGAVSKCGLGGVDFSVTGTTRPRILWVAGNPGLRFIGRTGPPDFADPGLHAVVPSGLTR